MNNYPHELTSLAPGSEFGDYTKHATCMSLPIDINTRLIIEQPTFDHLEGVESLQEHQKSSKATAETWRNDVRTSLFSVNDSILVYNNLFSSIYDPLYELARKIDTDQKARSDLVAGLTDLRNEITLQKTEVKKAGDKLTAFLTAMMNHESDLSGDAAKIKMTYEGDKGKIADLEKLIIAEAQAMANDASIIALGATGIVAGILVVSFGAFMWIETVGGSTIVIGAGLAVIAGGGAAIGIGVDQYNEDAKRKAQSVRELADIRTELAVANHLQADVATLVMHIQSVVDAIDKMQIAWSHLELDYNDLISALKSTDPGNLSFIVMSHLEAAKKQWNTIAEDAAQVKQNFLNPPEMKVETPTDAERGLTYLKVRGSSPSEMMMPKTPTHTQIIANVPATVDRNLHLKIWLENTANALLSFEQTLQSVGGATGVPTDVSAANAKLADMGKMAIDPAKVFFASIEDLCKHNSVLQTTATFPDDTIVAAAIKVFHDLASQVSVSTECGKTVVSGLNAMALAQMEIVSAINHWVQNLKSERDTDLKSIAEFEKLRDEAIAEKERSKNDFWWCFLGPIACAVVAVEQSMKVNAANAKIEVYNKNLIQTSNSLQNVVAAWTIADKLGSTLTTLGKNFDGILKALQVLAVSIDGVTIASSSLTPFIVRAHLEADAKQIAYIGSPRLEATARMMTRSINIGLPAASAARRGNAAGQISIELRMQQLTSCTLNIQSTAKLISSQPRLISVENLLKQNHELMVGHSHNWLMNLSAEIMSVLSRIHGLGVFIQFIGPKIRSYIEQDDIPSAVRGLESIDADLSRLFQHLFEIKLASSQFEITTKDDQLRFTTVRNVLRDQLVGEHGQLRALEDTAVSSAVELTCAMESVVNASTALLIRNIEWGLVLALSFGFGQIEFVGVEGAVMMNVLKDKANIVIKSVSGAASKKAVENIKIIDDTQVNLISVINKRGQTLADLSKLNFDIAVLHVLLQSVDAFSDNATRLRGVLGAIAEYFGHDMIASFYGIKVILNSGNKDEGLKLVNKAMDDWKSITSAANLLQHTFYASF